MAIASGTIDEVKRRVSLLEQVEKSRAVSRNGRLHKCLCPFHQESSPSFCIYPDSNSYYCFGCQASGNVISYVMQIDGSSFPEAVEQLAQQAGIAIEYTSLQDAKRVQSPQVPFEMLYRVNSFAQRLFEHGLTKAPAHIRIYLQNRLGSSELGREFGIGFASTGALIDGLKSKGVDANLGCVAGLFKKGERGAYYEYFRERIVFPIYSGKEKIIGFGGRIVPSEGDVGHKGPKYLNSPETPLYKKNSAFYHSLSAIEAIRLAGEVFVVEGYFDVISLHRWGIKNVVATCGTAFTEEHAKRLGRLAKRICLLFDGDEAG